jgi:hypothetical protein
MDDDQEVMDVLRRVDDALGGGADAGGLESDAVDDACRGYDKIRDVLPSLIKIAERIPVVGKRLASALKLLKRLGDQACPAGATA